MKIFNILFLLFSALSFSQHQKKIDSTFNHYFRALEIELNEKKDTTRDKYWYDEIILDDGDTIFTSKYGNQALIFLKNLTQIAPPVKYTAQSLVSYIDDQTLIKWKEWYTLNRKKIKWCKQHQKPYLKH